MKPILLAATFLAFCNSILLAAEAPAAGKNWPQFLGPTRNGVYAGGDLVEALPASPKVLWKVDIGHGWSAPVVVDGKLFIFHRLKDDAILDCLDAATGKQIWRSSYPTEYRDGFDFDPGPRATPAVADGRVFTFGAEGMLRAVDLATGKEIWAIDTVKKYKAQNGFFGLACSPLVVGDKLIVQLGGVAPLAGGGKASSPIMAFDVKTGELAWATPRPQDKIEAGYSSPTVATIHGTACIISLNREGIDIVDVDGRHRSEFVKFRSRQEASVNAATPIVVDDQVFFSASYGVGAKLLQLDGKFGQKVVWENGDSLSCHYATPVVKDGMLYGFHGRQDQGPGPEFRCVEWATGKVRWSQEDFGAGTVTLAGDKLIVMSEKGVLRFIAATPDGFKEHGHAQILPATVRAYPAIAGGLLYARGQEQLVCVDLRKKSLTGLVK